ncbi:hypothetical protein [Haloparvum sp. PAK95]|uniref:hypothetical protein n=1 Tax=Haloparvum sp. PAK95 TaxID=3418962 RepID=UPI003D2EB1F8
MTQERPLDTYKEEAIAGRVRKQLTVFPLKFKELGEGGELRSVLKTHKTLKGPKVHQAPEDFTEQYLIEPVLHALRYINPISEQYEGEGSHFVRRPTTFDKVENKQPDYKLETDDPESVCILEAKAANEEQFDHSKKRATEDIRKYIEVNTFAKYIESREKRYLIAIGTDGLRWTLWAKQVRTGETLEEITMVDLSDVVEVIARKENVIEGGRTVENTDIRRWLTDEFVPAFGAPFLVEHVQDHF